MKILIPKSLTEESDIAITVYCCLDALLWQSPKERLIDHDVIMYELYGNLADGGSLRRKLNGVIDLLIENGYIAAEEIAPGKYVVSPASFDLKGQKCCIGYFSDIAALVAAGKMGLVKFYFQLLETRDYNLEIYGRKSVIGYMPQTYLAKKTQLSVRTVSKYMDALEELGIIFIWREAHKNNHYCRCCDKKYLIKYMNNDVPVLPPDGSFLDLVT